MKKAFIVMLWCCCTISVFSQLKIDLKTPMEDKEKLKLAKAGLGAYLRQAEWAEVVNFGEDYSVWIKNLKRRFTGNVLHVEVNLELRTRADLGVGDLISARTICDTMYLGAIANVTTFEEREIIVRVGEQLQKNNKYKPLPLVLGSVTHVPLAGPVLEQGLKYLGVDLESKFTPDQAVEAMVLGAVLISNLKEMIDELPPAKK